MAIAGVPLYIFGGVDSRSNPVNRPPGRALRCRNWSPQESGELQLRYGYATVSQSSVSASFIHSFSQYKLWDQTRYIVFVQGTSIKRMALSDGTVTSLGSLTSSANCSFEKSDNKLFIVNGTDQKVYDGTTLRDMGIAQVTSAQIASATVAQVLRDPTAAEGTTVTVTGTNSGGTLGATTLSGYQLYMHYVHTSNGYGLGPGRAIGSRVITTGTTSQLQLANLPDLTAVTDLGHGAWKKVFSLAMDGLSAAKLCSTSNAAIQSLTVANASTGLNVTANSTTHGFSTGDVVEINVAGYEGVYTINATTVNTFAYEDLVHRSISTAGLTGTAYKLVLAAGGTTTINITSPATGSLLANADIGLPASTVGGSQPGYQIAFSLYNATTGAIGNRLAVTGRAVPTSRAIYHIQSLTDLSGVNSEYRWLPGRTGDGSVVPYVIADSAVNWQYADNFRTNIVLRESAIDGASELPTLNDVPVGLKQIKKVGTRLFARKANSPYIFWTNDSSDPTFIGKSEHAWTANKFDTFPTGEDTVCIAESDYELVVFTQNDAAIFTDVAGSLMWRGPWNIGCAGERAYVKTKYGDYWVTGDKRLAKKSTEGPIIVSAEYERGELAKIGDTYLSSVEMAYLDDAAIGKDQIKISCRDSSGVPFEVIHDFKLTDTRGVDGQGYESVYSGALASQYSMNQVRDKNGKMRVWCGGTDGRFYQLETGGVDSASTYDAEYIALVNPGEEKKSNPRISWQGDGQVVLSNAADMSMTLAQLQDESTKLDQTDSDVSDFFYSAQRKSIGVDAPEYFRLTLTSHPADATNPSDPMALSDPPHIPVEPYGRVYGIKMAFADSRGQ